MKTFWGSAGQCVFWYLHFVPITDQWFLEACMLVCKMPIMEYRYLWFCWVFLVGLEELPGSTWSCVCLFFWGMLLIERKLTYWCVCMSFANAAADSDGGSAGALPLFVHPAAGAVLRTGWANKHRRTFPWAWQCCLQCCCTLYRCEWGSGFPSPAWCHSTGHYGPTLGTQQPAEEMALETRRDVFGRKGDTEGRLEKRGEKRLQPGCEAI